MNCLRSSKQIVPFIRKHRQTDAWTALLNGGCTWKGQEKMHVSFLHQNDWYEQDIKITKNISGFPFFSSYTSQWSNPCYFHAAQNSIIFHVEEEPSFDNSQAASQSRYNKVQQGPGSCPKRHFTVISKAEITQNPYKPKSKDKILSSDNRSQKDMETYIQDSFTFK